MTPLSVLLDTAIRMSGLSAAEVARRSGVHSTTLSNCRRHREPDPHTLKRVLDALGLDIELVRAKAEP